MTTVALSSFKVQVENNIPKIPTTEVDDININQQIKAAVIAYSKILPEHITTDVTGDGGKYYPITDLTKWNDEFSRIVSVQLPAPDITTDEFPVFLEDDDWDDNYRDGSNDRFIFLPHHSPAATEAFRTEYTARYFWGTTNGATTAVNQSTHGFSVGDFVYLNAASTPVWVSTESLDLLATHLVTAVADADNFTATEATLDIPDGDFFAICWKASCLVCREIATRYSRTSDSTINVDSVNHPARAPLFATRADELCKQFDDWVGVRLDDNNTNTSGVRAGGTFVDWNVNPNYSDSRAWMFYND